MEESTPPKLRLDLNNFDSAGAQRSRYVLTSPRSLQSCARIGVKPVELLIKSLNELLAEQRDVPYEAVRLMHESYEKERMKLLKMCREERERIIQSTGSRWPGSTKVSGLEVVPQPKLKDRSVEEQSTGSIPYADLCFKGKSSSVGNGHQDRSTVCSFSLGDFRQSPATEIKLQRLTEDIKKKMCVTVSERDRKIAALMLVKHQEEQASKKHSQQEEMERQEARRLEEDQRAQADKHRRKKLKQNMQRWQEELKARRRLREHWDEQKTEQLEQEVLMQEDRWRRLKEEVEAQRREKLQAAQREAWERKCCQEKLLRDKEEVERRRLARERQVAVTREQRAKRSKVSQEKKKRRRLEEGNRRELLRHVLLKQQVEQQVEEEEAQMRSTLEEKLQRSCQKRAQVVDARQRELQERAAREEEQIQRARLKAELQSIQQLTYKQILVQLGQQRMERATVQVSARQEARAQQTHERNRHRELCHQRLKERVQREEEALRKVRESWISVKDWRRERLRRQREQIQEEAHRQALASFHMRERVRQETHSRTFDRMAREAQLTASMSRMKL
ncbi:uncharacterized protein V6R79_003851 [Siganus canaliculatus]